MSDGTKLPDQRPSVLRELLENSGIEVTEERVTSFMNEAIRAPYVPPNQENVQAAAAFILELVQAAKYGESWDEYKSRIGARKRRIAKFYPDAVTLESDAMGIVIALLRGKLTHKQAVIEFGQHVVPASDRQITNWINGIKPQAQKFIEFEDNLKGLAMTQTEKK